MSHTDQYGDLYCYLPGGSTGAQALLYAQGSGHSSESDLSPEIWSWLLGQGCCPSGLVEVTFLRTTNQTQSKPSPV